MLLRLGAMVCLALLILGCSSMSPQSPQPVVDTHWGMRVSDPFRHLERVDDPPVKRWMQERSDAAAAALSRLPGRGPLLDRIKQIEAAAGGVTTSVVRAESGRLFFLRRNPGENQFKLVWREGPQGADRVIFDPEAGATGQPRAVMDFAPSHDGSKLAYSVQSGGGEIGVLHVIEVASGRELLPPIDRIRYAQTQWLEDGSGFFYARLREGYEKLPESQRFADRTAHLRLLADGSDRAIVSPSRNPELQLPDYASVVPFQVRGTQMVAGVVELGVEPNLQLLLTDLAAVKSGRAVWRRVVETADEVVAVEAGHGAFFLKSARGAPNYRILRMPVSAPVLASAQVLVTQADGAVGALAVARDALYFTRREGVNTALMRVAQGGQGQEERVALPFAGAVELKSANAGRDGAVFELVSWTRAPKDYVFDPASGRANLLALARDGAFDAPADIESREVMVRSHDGTMVPLSIVSRRGAKLDGSNPTILYGYGAYGSTDDPFFSPRIYAWIERGGVWATAHVRGGGVFGKAWHEAGRKATKPNTWKDGIAAAEWLVANGWTTPARLAIYGGSAGGIFVGRAITERPELFAAAVPAVGTMDSVRFEAEANGPANIPEFGTVKKEDEFKALLAMSSYYHIRDGTPYPAVMAMHGVNDIRVSVWQSSKFFARLSEATSSRKPVLLRLEYDAGHGQGSTRAQAQDRSADLYSFLLWQFGVENFQPK